jgi:TonB-linked SusC/RagA family outer membrane protein
VEIPALNRSAFSDANGRFMFLGVSQAEVTVRVSLLGYRNVEQVVRLNQPDTRIAMTEVAFELNELVVTGTAGGTQRRSIGNVVTQVRAAETLEVAPITNVQSLLNARAPSVVVTPGTGMVGSGSQIRIRGSSSFSLSNAPLLVVDGVRADNAQSTGPSVQAFSSSVISRINDFSPEDIESIEIIKGPAAATLYGTEASNGVIHIITKKGREGSAAWTLSVRQGRNFFMNSLSRTPINYWRNTATNQVESLNLARAEKDRGTPLYRNGDVQNYALSLSGGTAEVRYYAAADWDKEQGAQWDNEQKRGSARLNLDLIPNPKLDVALNMGYTSGRTYLSCEAGCGGVTWASYFSTPQRNQGTITPDPRGARSWAPEVYYEADYFQDITRFTGSLQVNYRPTEWFSHRLTLGVDDVREDNQELQEKTPLYMLWSPTGRGYKWVNRRDILNRTLDYAGTLDFSVSPAISSSTSFGAQYYSRAGEFVTAQGNDFAVPGLGVVNAAAETFGFETYTDNVTVGVYLQQQFSWDDRIFVTGAIRADDNSAFGEEFDLVYYPKASATWVLSEEPFWDVGWVSSLRLRSAFGMAGQQPGAFDALRTYAPVPGPNDVSTVTPSSVGNPSLGPEKGSELEVGFEAGFLEDRIGVDFGIYRQVTSDAILLRPTAPSTGFPGSRFINVGEIKNQGFELVVRGAPISSQQFKWDATFSLSRNLSEILSLTDEEDRIVVSSAFGVEHRVGYPVGAWFNRKVVSAEFDANGNHIKSSMMCDNGSGGTTACYDGNTAVAPFVYLGVGEPKFEGTIGSTFTLGERIRLYGLMDFKTGFKKWDHVTRVRCSLYNLCLENVQPLDYVDSDPARLASYQTGAVFGAEYIRDSSFLRLREVSLSYVVPEHHLRHIGAKRATINLAARNLHTWSPWTGMDPEARFLSGARGGFGPLEQNHLPQLTSIVTSININF